MMPYEAKHKPQHVSIPRPGSVTGCRNARGSAGYKENFYRIFLSPAVDLPEALKLVRKLQLHGNSFPDLELCEFGNA